jgi:CubicO group peptidase (beta-lactamase class C family)
MKRAVYFFCLVIFFPFFIIACHSGNQPANAEPRLMMPDNKFSVAQLVYEDTNTAEWKRISYRLDSFYRLQCQAGFNGSVLIGYKGKILYERNFGFANKEAGIPLGTPSAVQLASITKTFTGAAILLLHQQKYLNIDDKVASYLPDFPYKDITIRMLLCHRSGLPEYLYWYGRYVSDARTPVYNNRILELMAKYKPAPEFKPNTRFKYCNTNFALLALVIERVTEMKYKDFMRRYIFDPLGMTHTFVYDPADPRPAHAAYAYKGVWHRDADMFADGVYGDKGIYSTTEDMYRWDQSFYQNCLLDNETIELAYGPCSFEKAGIKNYGLGWRMLCYPDGNKIIYHNGWWHSNNTSFYRFIQENFTIIILGNRFSNNIYHQAPVLYSLVRNLSTTGDFDSEE